MMISFQGYGDENMAVESEALREAMRNWATGITIVSGQHGDVHHGMTVSSFTSVSLDPPLVLVSLEKSTRTHSLVRDSGFFGVTILGEHQSEISDRFAGRHTEMTDRFAGLETRTLSTGVLFLKDALACFDCVVISHSAMGNHTIFIGEVKALDSSDSVTEPLIYYRQAYHHIQE